MILCVNEYEKIKIGNKTDVSKGIISLQIANALGELENKKDKSLFDWSRGFVSMKQWIGVISFKQLDIEIMPKIGDENNKQEIIKSILVMLNKVYDVKIQKEIHSNLMNLKNGFVEVLINLFVNELEYQLGKGIYKEYTKEEKNLKVLKGQLSIQKNIQKNIFELDKFYCRYSKLTESNIINKIIKFTLQLVSQITKNKNLNLALKKISRNFQRVNIDIDINREINRITYNKDNIRFKEIINLCKMFIDSIGTTINAGEYKGIAFLIDMNDLFEKYIYRIFKDNREINVKYQNKEYYLMLDKNRKKKFLLKPDIIIAVDTKKIILDTKWKIIKKGIDIKDIYQMNAYLDRIENTDEIILLFPQCKNNDKIINDYTFFDKAKKMLKIRTIDILKAGSTEFAQALYESLK